MLGTARSVPHHLERLRRGESHEDVVAEKAHHPGKGVERSHDVLEGGHRPRDGCSILPLRYCALASHLLTRGTGVGHGREPSVQLFWMQGRRISGRRESPDRGDMQMTHPGRFAPCHCLTCPTCRPAIAPEDSGHPENRRAHRSRFKSLPVRTKDLSLPAAIPRALQKWGLTRCLSTGLLVYSWAIDA